MEDKEKDLELNERKPEAPDSGNTAPEASDNAEYKVTLEENDNWDFDAKAPMIDDNLFLENENFVIDKEEFEKQANPVKPEREKIIKNNSEQIVINKKSLKFIPLIIITLLVVAALIVLGVRYFTVPNGKEGRLMNPASVAVTVDDSKISVGMYNYYYSSLVSYYEQYAAYGYFDLDTTQSYDNQFTTDDNGESISWADFFKEETLEEIKQVVVYYNKAVDEGMTLTDSQTEAIETQIESLKASASEEGISLNDYIENNFGDYCTEDTIRLMLEQYYVTINYRGRFDVEYKPTDAEIESYYNDNKSDYYQINFSYLATVYDTSSDETISDSMDTVEEYMDKITDRASIVALIPEVYSAYIEQDITSYMESDSTLTQEDAREQAIATYEQNVDGTINGKDSPFGDEINEWLFSDETPIGSKNYYIDEANGYAYIILKTENATRNEDEVYSVRHILIMPESDDASSDDTTESTTYTDEQWAAAEEKAQSILDEFNSGDKSEYSFALLAEENTDDTASTSSGSNGLFGGLYEGVEQGEMVSEFENWALDDSRQYGDTDIVKSDYGYHIMYFINKAASYKIDIIQDLRSEKLNELIEDADVDVHDSVVNRAIDKYNESKSEDASTTASSAASY